MELAKQPGNELYQRVHSSHFLLADWMTSVLQATRAASEEKWCGRGRLFGNPILPSGSLHLAMWATASIARNYVEGWKQSSPTCRPITCQIRVPCYGSMAFMELEQFWPTCWD